MPGGNALAAHAAIVIVLALAGCMDVEPAAVEVDTDIVQAPWPALEDATIRPGARLGIIVLATGQTFNDCTSNFVFASPDNASVYLGAAAHCFDDEGAQLGDPVDIAGGAGTGTLAYSSWIAMDEAGDTSIGRAANDFALVRIDNASRHLVHPAVIAFGGPTGLAAAQNVTVGARVLAWGNSSLRMDAPATSAREGVVVDRPSEWYTRVAFQQPGIPGDSGSGVLLRSGEALGILVTISTPPTNGVASLDAALQYANDVGGVDALLVAWELFDDGIVPADAAPTRRSWAAPHPLS